jgi:hypothetical protein
VPPIHRTAIAVILGLAVVFGLIGITRTLDLGAAKPASSSTSPVALAKSAHRLDRAEAGLRRARASHPPALPAVPKYPSAPAVAASASYPSAAQQVTYVRPPTRVVTVPRAGGDEGDDHRESEGADD